MRLIFAGTPAVAVPSLDAVVAAGHEVVAVLTRPDAPVGRRRVLTPSPVAQRAGELDIEIVHASKINAEITDKLASYDAETAAIVAYGALIPAAALAIPTHGWINLHFSLLPAWRGAAPVQHAIIHGDEITGASTFRLETGLDTGPVFGRLTEEIRPGDTSGILLERLSHSGAVLLQQTLSALESGTAAPVPQSGEVSMAPKLTIEDARIDWKQPALAVDRRIRGVSPEPGAWTTLDGQRFKLGPVSLEPGVDSPGPGRIRLAADKKSVVAGTGSHNVRLHTVQPAGRKSMAAADWMRGMDHQEDVVFV
ncbi:methionyl-tRNA formyltransferase [Arthrobacter sp. H14]|uniref:methionyl-tRNA formyltransferase n=1 Tax=Arthrobacter sp. H14 TaxID=1312959 RepID=UPI00047887BB|nr:methionyl-tRNA formyltransferase [Arthrobacter sp. H14]